MSAEHWTDRFQGQVEIYAELSDADIATKVRMLGRNDLEHEPIVQAARDRIARLSRANRNITAENERLTREAKLRSEQLISLLRLDLGYDEEPTYGHCPMRHMFAWARACDVISADELKAHLASCAETERAEGSRPLPVQLADVQRELAAAQQRLAALAVDPTKREELVGKCYDQFWQHYKACGSSFDLKDWSNNFQNGFIAAIEGAFLAGLVAPDPAPASLPEVAELERQLAEATKRLEELTKPADCADVAYWRGILYRVILAPSTAADHLNGEQAAKIIADAIVASRATLLQQIAELTEKLEAAKGLVDASGQMRESAQQERDRLAAELAATKQALAAARAFIQSENEPGKGETCAFTGHPCGTDTWAIGGGCKCGGCKRWRRRHEFLNPAPAKAAASEPDAGYWQVWWRHSGAIHKAGPFVSPAKARKWGARLPIEISWSVVGCNDGEPADHSGDAGEKVEPAERRFVCPECGADNFIEGKDGTLYCGRIRCKWRGDWAEVEAAKGDGEQIVVFAKTVDGKPLTAEQARELHRVVNEQASFEACPTMKAVEALRLHFGFGLRQFAEMCGVKPSDWSDLEHGRKSLIVDITLETALTKLAEATTAKEQQLAAANQAREAERQRAEAAEAVNGVLRALVERIAKATAESNTDNYPSLQEMQAALAVTPGRAANELRALGAFAEKCDQAMLVDEAVMGGGPSALIKRLRELRDERDKALAQGEQPTGEKV